MNLLKKYGRRLTTLAAITAVVLATLPSLTANAAALTQAYLRLDRMDNNSGAGRATGGTVCARVPGAGPSEAGIRVTFPGSGTSGASSYGVDSTAGNWTVTTSNLPAGTSAWPGINTASFVSGAKVYFPSTDISSTVTTYCFNFSGTTTLTSPTNTASDLVGSIATCTTFSSAGACDGSLADSENYATATVSGDQISVTATVPPTFSFALSGTTDALSTLSTTSVTSSPTPRTVTIGTNAVNGYLVWVKDANAGLTSSAASDTIDTSGTVDGACSSAYSSGTEFYGLDADETSDPQTNGAIQAEYNCSSTTVGAFATNFTEVATGTGPTSGYILTLNNRAAASTVNKPATDYADTITLTGAGNF